MLMVSSKTYSYILSLFLTLIILLSALFAFISNFLSLGTILSLFFAIFVLCVDLYKADIRLKKSYEAYFFGIFFLINFAGYLFFYCNISRYISINSQLLLLTIVALAFQNDKLELVSKPLVYSFFFVGILLLVVNFMFPIDYTSNRIISNPNSVGLCFFLLSYFAYVSTEEKAARLGIIILVILLAFLFRARTSILSMVSTSILIMLSEKHVRFQRKITWLIIICLCLLNLVIILLYTTENVSSAIIVFRFAGKGLFTGRQYLWRASLDAISKSPIIGYGSGISLDSLIQDFRSVHNYYLQIILQTGFVGLVCFILFIYFSLNKLANMNTNKARIGYCYIVGILVASTFEVFLTQNNFTFSVLTAAIYGTSRSPSSSDIG